MRSSVIFMGALLARCGEARLSPPGGCQLGKRPIDLHLMALRALGAQVEEDGERIYCRSRGLRGAEIRLPFPSVGATENAMLAACGAEGETGSAAPPGSRRSWRCRITYARWGRRSPGRARTASHRRLCETGRARPSGSPGPDRGGHDRLRGGLRREETWS